jgi:hypothetical protein
MGYNRKGIICVGKTEDFNKVAIFEKKPPFYID